MVEFPTSGPAAFYLPSPAGPAGFGIKRGKEVQGGRVTGRGARGRPSRQKHHGGGKTKQENRVCFSVLKNRPVLFCAEGKRAVFSFLARGAKTLNPVRPFSSIGLGPPPGGVRKLVGLRWRLPA